MEAELSRELSDEKLDLVALSKNPEKLKEVADRVGKRVGNDRDDHEVFGVAYVFFDFYSKDSEICFEMCRGFDPKCNLVASLGDLNKFRVGSASDFAIISDGVKRIFQLKRYRGELSVLGLSAFLEENCRH